MQNLRIVSVNVVDSTNITVSFTHELTNNIIAANIQILSEATNVPASKINSIKVKGKTIEISCLPLTPYSMYYLLFNSVPNHPFQSLHGEALLSEDNVVNKYLIIAPIGPDNIFKDYLHQFLANNIYNLDDETVVGKYLQSLATQFSKALADIGQVKNDNYLSTTIQDELKTRGQGPYDRLDEEGAYQLLRVGRTPSGTNATKTLTINEFPYYPITLQKESNQESLKVDSVDGIGILNINSLILTTTKYPVTKVNNITFTLATADPIFVYNIETLGYQLKDSRYDKDYASTYLQLNDNQVKLNNAMLSDAKFAYDKILSISIQYEYKNLGVVVDSNSVVVFAPIISIRETLPPLTNVFNLKHAPIIDGNNNVCKLNGVEFTDPNNLPGVKHPAFINEIEFKLNSLPFIVGQYSIDYATGTVYVYGADTNRTGTGAYPPVATYKYKYTYKADIDYTYDIDALELVALPYGNLIGNKGIASYKYEEVFCPGKDYKSALHQEELSERVENRLLAMNVIRAVNSPITNVFRLYNETSGEIYSISRWADDKVYFRYSVPPKILNQISERVKFHSVQNEMLFINSEFTNTSLIRIFKIFLDNNTIMAASEDSVANAGNTSLMLSKPVIFANEKWYNNSVNEFVNADNLNVGEYSVDYINGIIYCAVETTQDNSIGFATYKINNINPDFPHLTSVEDLYYSIGTIKQKTFAYSTFADNSIIMDTPDNSFELYLENSNNTPYQIISKEIGAIVAGDTYFGVSNQINSVRSIYEYSDLVNSITPINFGRSSISSGYNITTDKISASFSAKIRTDGAGSLYITIDEKVNYLSPNIVYTFSVIRASDSVELWDGTGTLELGNQLKLILPYTYSPVDGEIVNVSYSFEIVDLSRVVVDYDKGELFTDYTYLADELILSYEYGDNILDFRESLTISPTTQYYVSYRAGALRDALYQNFGNLINIPELTTFDIDFNRERYRDALIAGLSSFIQGPTITAIKNIGKTISHVQPEVIESMFQGWSLGNSLLNPQQINSNGSFQVIPAKHNNGVLINSADQTITFPISSNIKLEEGTFQTWVMPQWNGIDNDAMLTFSILQGGVVIDESNVFIGASEEHPVISNGVFSVDKNSNVNGTPNKNKDGVFIYYDKDPVGNYYRWFIEIYDGNNGVVSANYKIKITTTGSFYDLQNLVLPKTSNVSIFTGISSVNYNITGGISDLYQGLTFVSDVNHYILDSGSHDNNRFSIFKDISGYLNFKVVDGDKINYEVSADVSNWESNDLHHVAASWKLNTINNKDEMHLFVDGFEVANIITYAQDVRPYLNEKFRTVNPEEVVGIANRDTLSGSDLEILAGYDGVYSLTDFSAYQILAGDVIHIDEVGFDPNGYVILAVNGASLQLDQNMPLTLINGRFSINRISYTASSKIDIVPNITVSTVPLITSGTGLINNIVLDPRKMTWSGGDLTDVLPGYSIRIEYTDSHSALVSHYNFTISEILTISQFLITEDCPITFHGTTTFSIYSNVETELPGVRALNPFYSISKDVDFNNILTISNGVKANDLIFIKSLGLNYRKIKKQYYVWGDGYENVLMTRMPPPISLDEVIIKKVILPATAIGPTNSTIVSGSFSANVLTYSPVVSELGRTLSITLSGNNVDWNLLYPKTITIHGVSGGSPISEVLSFTEYGTLDSVNLYTAVSSIDALIRPIDINKNACVITIKEKYNITNIESGTLTPIVRYSYQIGSGTTLESPGGNSVLDNGISFSDFDVNNYLIISSPVGPAGSYKILSVSEDKKILDISNIDGSLPSLAAFTGGTYKILNVNDYRSGLQNGFFTLEVKDSPGTSYLLTKGFYEVEYCTYARIKLDLSNKNVFLGSDINSSNQCNCVLDQVKIYSIMLTDTRIGEVVPSNNHSITKDFNSIKALRKDNDTLMLLNFDEYPFTNSADFYINTYKHNLFHSSTKVNDNFTDSLVLQKEPLILNNDGILDTRKEGTIEFWTSPLYDTGNDPNYRFYFDAYSAVIEECVSVDNVSVKLSSPASKILSVNLKSGDDTDYFAGGKLEVDTQKAIVEETVSLSNSSASVLHSILQVISVKIAGDFSGKDYFANGSISSDRRTIYLGVLLPQNSMNLLITYQSTENKNETLNTQVIRLNKRLPKQKCHVVVKYLPKGVQGDRITIFKDQYGYINFGITASGIDYVVRAPTLWIKNTWHRVKASYKINSGVSGDEMRLFLDGFEYSFDSGILFGTGILFGDTYTFGEVRVGNGNTSIGSIKFKDPINTLYIGSEYTKDKKLEGLINNLRISDVSRPIYSPYSEPLDVNYNSNLNAVYPVTEDLYTTYLLYSGVENIRNEDFTTIVNKKTGSFNFDVNIIDSFSIVQDNVKSKNALEKLIKVLKPANSKVYISYT